MRDGSKGSKGSKDSKDSNDTKDSEGSKDSKGLKGQLKLTKAFSSFTLESTRSFFATSTDHERKLANSIKSNNEKSLQSCIASLISRENINNVKDEDEAIKTYIKSAKIDGHGMLHYAAKAKAKKSALYLLWKGIDICREQEDRNILSEECFAVFALVERISELDHERGKLLGGGKYPIDLGKNSKDFFGNLIEFYKSLLLRLIDENKVGATDQNNKHLNNIIDLNGHGLLHVLMEDEKNLGVVEYLLKSKLVDVNQRTRDEEGIENVTRDKASIGRLATRGESVLERLVKSGRSPSFIGMLVDHGVDIELFKKDTGMNLLGAVISIPFKKEVMEQSSYKSTLEVILRKTDQDSIIDILGKLVDRKKIDLLVGLVEKNNVQFNEVQQGAFKNIKSLKNEIVDKQKDSPKPVTKGCCASFTQMIFGSKKTNQEQQLTVGR